MVTVNSVCIKLLASASMRFGGFYAPFFAPYYLTDAGGFLNAIGVASISSILTCLLSPLYSVFIYFLIDFSKRLYQAPHDIVAVVGFHSVRS